MTDRRYGPYGGLGGVPFDLYTIPAGTRLEEIHVFTDRYVHAIQFVCVDTTGTRIELARIGGDSGFHNAMVLDPDEYVTAIGGLYGWYIDSIYFQTNKRRSANFGGYESEQDFYLEIAEGYSLVGVFGRADWYIDALGVIVRPLVGNWRKV